MDFSGKVTIHRLKRFLMRSRRRLYGLRALVPGWREHHRFESMVGPLGFWDELQKYHLQVLTTHGLEPEHSLLDIGCGPLQGGVAFIRHLEPRRYAGIDINPTHIDAAHAQVSRHRLSHKKPQLVVSSTFGEEELNGSTFDMMWASQILYYFDDANMEQLLAMVCKRLRPGGRFLGDTFAPDHYEFTHPENPGRYVRHTHESLSALAEPFGLRVRCLGTIGEFGYPKRLSLRTNPVYAFSRLNDDST